MKTDNSSSTAARGHLMELRSGSADHPPRPFALAPSVPGVSKLSPVGQAWPDTYFCAAYKLRMGFIFLSERRKIKRRKFGDA